ncbi:MAG: penicillin acylase family protein, partial [Chloroflexi bacterium]|nr:penicillin acylase family protein [Chloroflexota bacterium]
MNLPLHAFRLLLGRRRPITSGTLTAPGIEREVVIRRDGWGVPHISAGGEADAWYGLGFCHGQDRAFQLEASLRVVRGTLAELLGPEALAIDRLSRRVGFVRSSREQLGVLDPGVRAVLEAYAAGVNAGATVGSRKKAHEFALLRSRPSAWTAADVLGYLKLTSFLLSTNWDVELARYQILTRDGPEALTALDPIYRQWQPVISPPGVAAGPALERLTEEIASLAGIAHLGGGSNNWSLAPGRTATGRPILANDPHLAPALPPHWYLTHLGTSDWSVAGASFVGVPGIPVGHNGFAAWGVTVGMTDNTDLFVEEVGPDGRSVRQDGRFVPCDVLAERIGVKGQPDVAEEVLVTPRGPIIGPALDGEPGAISLRAIWLDPLPLKGLVRVHHTRGFADFHRSLADWPFLPLNLAYADESGAIGWQLIGTAPRRRKGNGAVPLPGSDPGAGWEGEPVPYEEMPHLLDPDVGFVVTANNKAARDGTGPFLTVDWIEGYRAARIAERLRERCDWDLPSTARLQLDEESIPWREMR